MRSWLVPAAVWATLLLVTTPALAQSPALAGINQISGARSGYLDVRIPVPVRISFDWRPGENATFAIRSEGFAGVMLRRLEATDDLDTLVAAARFEPGMLCGGCETPEEALIVGITGIESQASADYSWQIPAGEYRLYLLTDGRPANVRITLAGLAGSRLLHPEHGVEPPVPETIPLLSSSSAGPIWAFGSGDRLDSRGAQLWGGLVYTGSDGNVEIEGCSHEGSDPVATAFAPGCPGGSPHGHYGFTYVANEGPVVHGAGFVVERDDGDWSVGGNVVAAGSVAAVGWASVVLPFRGDGTRIAPPAQAPGAPGGAPGPAPQTQEAGTPRPPAGRARVLTRSARVRRGRVAVLVGCSGSGECSGSIRIDGGRRSLFRIPAGRRVSIRLAVPRALARRVQRRGRAFAAVVMGDERARLTLRR